MTLANDAKRRIHLMVDLLAEIAKRDIGIQAAAMRSRIDGKDYRRSLGQLKRWRVK